MELKKGKLKKTKQNNNFLKIILSKIAIVEFLTL